MDTRYRWDDFVLDLDRFRLERAGTPLSLEPKAFNLLALLVSRPDHVFTKQELFETLWPGTAVTDHALTRVVAQVRRVLGDDVREARYLETVPTRGYRWIYPVAVDSASAVTIAAPPKRSRRTSATLFAMLVVLVVGALAWSQFRARPGRSATPESGWNVAELRGQFPVQVTTHAGLDLNPAFSPHGDALAFASDRTGAFEIHIRSLGSGATDVAITTDRGQNVQPAWSPDGRFIAYHSSVHGGIWIVPARGGTARLLVSKGSHPKWSPDGRQLVYQTDEHPDIAPTGFGAHVGSTLMLVDAAGGTPRPLTVRGHPAGGHGAPAWSSDGRYVAFSVFDGGERNGVWVVRVATGVVTAIDRDVRAYETTFAEADRALYVAGGEPVIHRLPFDPKAGAAAGARAPVLIPGVPGVRGLSVSPDGSQLVFAGVSLSSHICAQALETPVRPVGEPYPLTSDTSRRNYTPVISPDGASVAFMSARRGEAPNIWLMQLQTGRRLQLTDDEAFDSAPEWFPDGRRIAYVRDDPDQAGVRAVDVATRLDELVITSSQPLAVAGGSMPAGARVTELQLSPSVRQVAFAVAVPPLGFRRLYVVRAGGGTPQALTDGTSSIGYPAWSPDERRLGVEIQDEGNTHLGILDVATRQLHQLTQQRGQVWVRSWSPDGQRVAAAVLNGRQWSVEWFDATTGAHGTLVPPGESSVYYRYPQWSPAGNLVVFERGQMSGNIWRLTLAARP